MSAEKLVGENALTAIASDIKTTIGTKADASTTYNKTEVDTALDLKADKSDTYTKAQVDSAVGAKADASSVYTKVETDALISNKADIDGEYDLMTVGNAKQLKSNVGENDKVPYLFRTSGGSIDIGESETDMLVGGTVAWNQIVKAEAAAYSATSGGTVSYDTNTNTVTYTLVGGTLGSRLMLPYENSISHKYLIFGSVNCDTAGDFRCEISRGWTGFIRSITANTKTFISGILAAGTGTDNNKRFQFFMNGQTDYVLSITDLNIFDLTAMFGSTIADYIYSLEQSVAGSGVAWFRNLFPKSYYAYNSGSLMSVKTSKHITVGFNAYDNNTSKAKVVGGNQYQITGTYTSLTLDGETITPNESGIFTPDTSGEITVVGGNATNTCIHLVWDGERNGEYEPYVKHEYALDSDLELRGIPKLDSNNKLYYDGDTYESDGTVTRKYGIVDLSTAAWSNVTSSSTYAFIMIADRKDGANINYIANLPSTIISKQMNDNNKDFVIYFTAGTFDSREALTSALSNSKIVYELATPTTETADSYQNPQIVNDFGTEEYVDSRAVQIPVGHETFYQANLRAKLEMSPDSPSGNGDYIVRQTDGQNEYVPLVKELPTLPSTDGTYTLKCIVSGGVATLSWVAD